MQNSGAKRLMSGAETIILNYVPTMNNFLLSYMTRYFLSDLDSRSSKSKLWRLLLNINFYPANVDELVSS
jgi:hypothetical protein